MQVETTERVAKNSAEGATGRQIRSQNIIGSRIRCRGVEITKIDSAKVNNGKPAGEGRDPLL